MWHADTLELERYAAGDLEHVRAMSIEAHLLGCADCRRHAGAQVDDTRLERLWLEVVDTVDAPRARMVERVVRRLGVGQATARLLGVTPSLQLSWLLGVAIVLTFATSAAYSGDAGLAAFLLVAPMVPLAGVAAAFGPGADPAFEIAAAAPMPALRLVLVRAAALLGASLGLTGAAALALPGLGWTAAAWILPSFGVTLATLALSTAMTPERAAVAVATGWVVLVSAGAGAAGEWLAPFGAPGQVVAGLVAVIAAVVIASRRHTFDVRSAL